MHNYAARDNSEFNLQFEARKHEKKIYMCVCVKFDNALIKTI